MEKLACEYLLPHTAHQSALWEATLGRPLFTILAGLVVGSAAFWGVGSLMMIPACLHVRKWKIQVNKHMDFKALLSAMPLIVFNHLLGVLIYSVVMVSLLPDSSFDWKNLPSTSTLARDVFVWVSLNEVCFYGVHRFFHENKRAYAAIHKLHHTWTAPVSLVAIYCHPLEHAVANVGPLLVGPMLCQSHAACLAVFLFLGLLHTLAVHSGYWICDDNGMHDEHHRKFNVNFGVLGVMDYVFGTYRLPEGATTHFPFQKSD